MNLTRSDRLGLVKPAVDAHTLGMSAVMQLLHDCSYPCIVAEPDVCRALDALDGERSMAVIENWIRRERITHLGFSYRLDPLDGVFLFKKLMHQLKARRLFSDAGGLIQGVCFAGLPEACSLVRAQFHDADTFSGDETPAETLRILGIDPSVMPNALARGVAYDEDRLSFAEDLIRKGEHLGVCPVDRSGYDGYGTAQDTLVSRVQHSIANGLPPLVRAHVGPYLPDRAEAVRRFTQWTRALAASGFLDILSIGTSQLSQAHFGEDWGDRPNGGGVPLNSPDEFADVWQAARPMLVRTYAGARNIPALAAMYEQTIHIAWHALSLWWFCRIDGRGPYSVRENLDQHVETLKYIARTGKPFEANVPHHFAFRGADDVTCIVAEVIAARTAKAFGIRHFVLQNMLNTPKYTWGVQDLAKSRSMLQLVRELEDDRFRVILQPRAGLDYFSHDLAKARVQLAAASALMDDIEPNNPAGPPVIHVVSYSEASHLADPPVIDESIQITRHAIDEYRKLRARGQVDDMSRDPEVAARVETLLSEARMVLNTIDATIPDPYTPAGLYQIFASGFLPVPYLWACRDEFPNATRWQTRPTGGAVDVVDEKGKIITASERMGDVLLLRLAASAM